MLKLKQSLITFASLAVLVGLIALVTPAPGQGQGNSGNAPSPGTST